MADPADPASISTGAALGVDGGAGRLKFAVRRPDGRIAHHQAPGANPILVGMQEFLQRLEQGILAAVTVAEVEPADIESAGLGLSGVDRPDQIDLIASELRGRLLPHCRRIWVGNDALPALRQGAGALRGVILIAGTGSICFGVGPTGEIIRTGGWGGELGDEGSAFWIGREALQSACRMADGRQVRSALVDVLLHELEIDAPQGLIPWTARLTREMFKQKTASLFPAVASLAAGGDAACVSIIEDAHRHLITHVETVLRRLSTPGAQGAATPVVCAGGIFAGDEQFYSAFEARLKQACPSVAPVRLLEPASLGALALGAEAAPLP